MKNDIKCIQCGKSDYTEGIDFDDMSFCRECCEKAGMGKGDLCYSESEYYPRHKPAKTFRASVGDYEYFENKAVEDYKRRLIEEIESWAVNISSEKNPRWVKNTIIDIIGTLK